MEQGWVGVFVCNGVGGVGQSSDRGRDGWIGPAGGQDLVADASE